MYPYPLGLPKGTIRASVTLLFFFTSAILVMTSVDTPNSLATTIVIVVSFYFGTRKGIPPKTETLKTVKADKGETAFNLPANSVRTILFAGFIIMTLKIIISAGDYNEVPDFVLEVLVMIIGFVGGSFLSRFVSIFQDDSGEVGLISKIVLHGKALIVLLFTIVTCFLYLFTLPGMDSSIVFALGWITNLVIGFYFGSRK